MEEGGNRPSIAGGRAAVHACEGALAFAGSEAIGSILWPSAIPGKRFFVLGHEEFQALCRNFGVPEFWLMDSGFKSSADIGMPPG
jgi:hypothetical protein